MSDVGLSLRGGAVVTVLTHLRSILGICLMIPATAFYSLAAVVAGTLGLHGVCTKIQRQWSKVILGFFGIGIEVRNEHHVPPTGGGIVVFNHQSLFDIPVLLLSTRKHLRFGAKVELFRIPIFGAGMRAVGTLPIARENRHEVLRIYDEAKSRFVHDFVFVLAPEGTRQKEPVIGRFKKGPFLFAMNAGVPVIPVVLKGAHEVLPKKSIGINVGRWRRQIQVEYLPPHHTEGLTPADIEALVTNVREQMIAVYDVRGRR